MPLTRRLFLAAVPVAVAGGYLLWPAPAAVPVESLSAADFASVKAAVRPQPGEDPFAIIPWQTSLWDARVKAARDGKPILLWEMDGHPLGCG